MRNANEVFGEGAGLEALFPGVTAADFLTKYWPRNALVGRGPLSRFSSLLSIPQLLDIEGLLALYKDPVPCWGSHGNAVDVPASQAYQLYLQGFTLYIVAADKFVKPLRPFVERLEAQLGLQPGAGSVNVFATRAGFGASPHYDVTYGFSVQIKGRKTWRTADNTSVTDPTRAHSLRVDPEDELLLYADAPMPEAMPPDSNLIEMEPGDVIFTPSGRWHTTVCKDDSIAIDFNFAMRPWVEFILPVIRNHLVRAAGYRERTGSVLGNRAAQLGSQRNLQALLADLPSLLKGLTVDEVLGSMLKLPDQATPTEMYQRVPDCRIAVGAAEGGNVALTVTTGAGERQDAEVEPPFRGLCEWLSTRTEPFSGIEAIAAARPDVPPLDVVNALGLFEELGAVKRMRQR